MSITATHVIPRSEWKSYDTLRDKLIAARCRLMTREPWYGHVAMGIEWLPSEFQWQDDEAARTMGVRIMSNGTVQCLWYPGFVQSQTLEQLFGVVQHEIEHLVRCHCTRIGAHRDPRAWNIAADMCVNGQRSNPKFGYKQSNNDTRVLPLDGQCVWVPDTWQVDQTAEFYYDKVYKGTKRCPCCQRPMAKNAQGGESGSDKGKQQKGQGNGQGEQQNGQGGGQGQQGQQGGSGKCKHCGQEDTPGSYQYGDQYGNVIDDHSVWSQTEVSQDEARQIIRDIVQQASIKTQGNVPGHLSEAIKELNQPQIYWRELLRQYIGRHVGGRRSTYSRPNRRIQEFGAKGFSHRAAGDVRVIVDTSGSVGKQELEQFFAEIDQIASRCKVMVLQWDHAFQGYSSYRRGDWKRFKVNGRGGTDMAAPIKWLEDNKHLGDCQILLTDGYCNWAEKRPWFPAIGMINVITSPDTKDSGWGYQVRLKVSQ